MDSCIVDESYHLNLVPYWHTYQWPPSRARRRSRAKTRRPRRRVQADNVSNPLRSTIGNCIEELWQKM